MMKRLVFSTLTIAAALLGGCSLDRFLPDVPEYEWDAGDVWDASTSDAADDGDARDGAADDSESSDAAADGRSPDVAEDTTYFDAIDVTHDVQVGDPTQPPILYAIYPSRGSTEGGQLVTLEGENLTVDIEIRVGGQPVSQVDLVDEYEALFVTEPLGPGVYDVKVTAAGGVAVLPNAYTVVAPLRVTSVEPASGGVDGRYSVEVRGEGFDAATRFVFGGRDALAARVDSPNSASVQVPPGGRGATVDVAALDTRVAVLRDAFSYVADVDLRQVVPAAGPTLEATTVRLDGIGLDDDCVAFFDGVASDVFVSDAGWPSAIAPAGAAGAVDVAVDCAARGASFLEAGFARVDSDEPQLLAVWPPTGFTRGGEVVTLSGVSLAAVESVSIGGRAASVLIRDDGFVDVLTPGDRPGPVDVSAVVDGRELVLTDAFTYISLPIFTGLDPFVGPTAGGFEVTVSGSGLDGVETLSIDGRPVEVTSRSAGSLVFTAPAGAGGAAMLQFTTGALTLDTGLVVRYADDVRVDAFTPGTASAGGGTVVYVTGAGFDDRCLVYVDGQVAATDVRGSTLIAFVAPPHEAGPTSLRLGGCAERDLLQKLTYVDPTRLPGGVFGGDINGEMRVSVRELSTNAPIAGASVSVGVRSSTPFVAITGADGLATFTDPSLVGPQTVTAYAAGRSAETITDVNARDVTIMLAQIPPPPCDPSDPECVPPPAPPTGTVHGHLEGLGKLIDPPPGTTLRARIETTRYASGYLNPDAGPGAVLDDEGDYSINTRLGDIAVIALCGYEDTATLVFTPLAMGVARGISVRPDSLDHEVDLDCDIPLDQSVTLKLMGAPPLTGVVDAYQFPGRYRAKLMFDFFSEGVFESLPEFVGTTPIFTGGRFPALVGPLAGVEFDVTAGVYPQYGYIPAMEGFARYVDAYGDLITIPELLPMPIFELPVDGATVTDGRVEWRVPFDGRMPDFWVVSASSSTPSFPRWNVFIPGWQTSFNFADFPDFSEIFGVVPGPGAPAQTLAIYIRGVDVDSFDYNDFDRYALRSRTWNAATAAYRTWSLAAVPPM